MTDKITTDSNSVSYPNEKPGPDARIANPSPGNQKTTADSQAGDELRDYIDNLLLAMLEYQMKNEKRLPAKTVVAYRNKILRHAERRATEARIDENRTYWWHQQKAAEKEGISKHALDRISALTKEIQSS